MAFVDAHKKIQEIIQTCEHDADRFVGRMREEHVPHISFSQISTVEFCPRRYYLQYVQQVELDPIPDYFTKGKTLHQILAAFYSDTSINENTFVLDWDEYIQAQFEPLHAKHIVNAIRVHQENAWQKQCVTAVEHPFVMMVDPSLPPMVGVIDLILKQNGTYTLVDHKTGRNFYTDNDLQVAIYAHFIEEAYGTDCRLFYDHYRWVNNLERIRKPAFQRVEVRSTAAAWPRYLKRIRCAYHEIAAIRNGNHAADSGECFRCPYRHVC